MLRDVISIVRGVDDVCVVQDSIVGETGDYSLDNFVNRLECLKTSPIKVVVVGDYFVRELGKMLDPRCSSGL